MKSINPENLDIDSDEYQEWDQRQVFEELLNDNQRKRLE